MAEEMSINFYSYMYGGNKRVPTFDDIAELVDLANIDSINKAFVSYLEERQPPAQIKGNLLEDGFYESTGEGEEGNAILFRYEMEIPGMEEDTDSGAIKGYFEEFLERIGAENGSDGNIAISEVELRDNERGGLDCDIYVEIGGPQIKRQKETDNSKSNLKE